MPSSTTPGSSTSSVPGSDVDIGLRRRSSVSALPMFPQSVSRGGKFSRLNSSHICYGLPVCSAPCTDQTGLPANGAFYIQAFNGSVTLPVVGYNYNIDWTPMLVGLSPTRMAASLAARSSPFRCGPGQSIVPGQTRDLPASGAFLLHVMCSPTPAGWQRLALAALHMLRSTFETASAPAANIFRGSIRLPMQSLCTLRGRRYRRLTQHLLPGALLGLTRSGLSPVGLHQLWLAPS
jgi:hypothetical protein